MIDLVERLRYEANKARQNWPEVFCVSEDTAEEAADEIERLRKKCDAQAEILRKLTPENFPGTMFIHAELGSKDTNGMPEKLLVVPSYGVDFAYVYERSEKTAGPQW